MVFRLICHHLCRVCNLRKSQPYIENCLPLQRTRGSMLSHNRASSSTLQSSIYLCDVLRQWVKTFERQKIPEPDASAELICAFVLKQKTLDQVDKTTALTSSQLSEINRLCQLRLTRMPVQYVLGEWDFHDLTLKMMPPVLIPRPETEELGSFCINTLRQQRCLDDAKFLEIGSGSGAVSVTLLKNFPKIQGAAVDISPAACKLTTENALLCGVHERLTVIEGDFKNNGVIHQLSRFGPYSLIVSNPPYIPTDEIKSLEPEIVNYEDHVALDGGPDGMRLIQQILLRAPPLLQKGGHVWLEVAPYHPPLIAAFLMDYDLSGTLALQNTYKDIFGKNRFCHVVCS